MGAERTVQSIRCALCRPVLVRKNADGIYFGRAQYVHKRDEIEKEETVLRVVWWKAHLLWYSAAKKNTIYLMLTNLKQAKHI